MAMKTVQEAFDAMPGSFQAQEARGLTAAFQFEISGDGGGEWYVEVQNGALTVARGRHPQPDVTFQASAENYLGIAEGRINNAWAAATGKIKVRGSMLTAMKLQKIFKR
jgi:putative sterol carrier protein